MPIFRILVSTACVLLISETCRAVDWKIDSPTANQQFMEPAGVNAEGNFDSNFQARLTLFKMIGGSWGSVNGYINVEPDTTMGDTWMKALNNLSDGEYKLVLKSSISETVKDSVEFDVLDMMGP